MNWNNPWTWLGAFTILSLAALGAIFVFNPGGQKKDEFSKEPVGDPVVSAYPPTLQKIQPQQVESGDEYTVVWIPAAAPNSGDFYEIQTSEAKTTNPQTGKFTSVHHEDKTLKTSLSLNAPPLSSQPIKVDYHHHVRAGRMPKNYPPIQGNPPTESDLLDYLKTINPSSGKTYYQEALWSSYSNIETLKVQVVAPPMLNVNPDPAIIWPGQEYTLTWSSVTKPYAVWYDLQETNVSVSSFPAPKLMYSQIPDPDQMTSNEVRKYWVQAETDNGIAITKMSNSVSVNVQYVNPPKVTVPASVKSGDPYKVSWTLDNTYPTALAYTLTLWETPQSSGNAVVIPLDPSTDIQNKYKQRSKSVTAATKFDYTMRAFIGSNPMTKLSQKATVTVNPPTLPAPAPKITNVDPQGASKGNKVTLEGADLDKVTKVELIHISQPTQNVTVPSSFWKKVVVGSSTNIELTVPESASLRTTHVKVTATVGTITKSDQEQFVVYRKPGSFVEIIDYPKIEVGNIIKRSCTTPQGIITIAQATGKYSSGTSGTVLFDGKFTKNNNPVGQPFSNAKPLPFQGPSFPPDFWIGGLGISPECKVGVFVFDGAPTSAGKQIGMNFYNLSLGKDAKAQEGKQILGNKATLIPHQLLKAGYQLFFSPDDSLVALVGAEKQAPPQQYKYKVTDLLTGNSVLSAPVTSQSGPAPTDFAVIADNKLSLPVGTPKKLPVPP